MWLGTLWRSDICLLLLGSNARLMPHWAREHRGPWCLALLAFNRHVAVTRFYSVARVAVKVPNKWQFVVSAYRDDYRRTDRHIYLLSGHLGGRDR